jgi:hypothetical protein
MMWKILSIMDLMVVGAAVVVVAEVEVGVVVPTEAEVEIKKLVASMSPMRMDPHEVGGPTFPRRRHTQVAAEGGAEAEVRVEVREEVSALTHQLKNNLSRELPRGL